MQARKTGARGPFPRTFSVLRRGNGYIMGVRPKRGISGCIRIAQKITIPKALKLRNGAARGRWDGTKS